jgi:putative FmdB family regulatory protein
MPLYEYECAACGHQFEVIRKFSDPPEQKCPKCGGGPVHKLQSAPAFQFKGSGWYVTDYGKSGQSDNKAGSDSKSDSKKNGATETAGKSESASANSASTSSTPAPGTAGQKSGD